jgi:hypothetical protein
MTAHRLSIPKPYASNHATEAVYVPISCVSSWPHDPDHVALQIRTAAKSGGKQGRYAHANLNREEARALAEHLLAWVEAN